MTKPKDFAIIEWNFLTRDERFLSLDWQARYIFLTIWACHAHERSEKIKWKSKENLIAQLHIWTDCPLRTIRKSLSQIIEKRLAIFTSDNHLLVKGVREKHKSLRLWNLGLNESECALFSLNARRNEKLPFSSSTHENEHTHFKGESPANGENTPKKKLPTGLGQKPSANGISKPKTSYSPPVGNFPKKGQKQSLEGAKKSAKGLNRREQEREQELKHIRVKAFNPHAREGTPSALERNSLSPPNGGSANKSKKTKNKQPKCNTDFSSKKIESVLKRVSDSFGEHPDIEGRMAALQEAVNIKGKKARQTILRSDHNRLLAALLAAMSGAKNPAGCLMYYLRTKPPPDGMMKRMKDILNSNNGNPKPVTPEEIIRKIRSKPKR